MALYRYTAMDKSGRTVGSVMEALDEASLSRSLHRDGLFLMNATVVKIAAAAAPPAPKPKTMAMPALGAAVKFRIGGAKVTLKEVTGFTKQFSLMVKAALPILQALTTLTVQQKNPAFQEVLLDVQERVKRGEFLSQAFGRHPKTFDAVFISLISAGEASGTVPTILPRISDYLEFQTELSRKMRSAMVYPALVLSAAVSVVLFLMTFVLPNFVEIFNEFKAPLPLPTIVLLAISTFMREYWYVNFGSIIAFYFLGRRWMREPDNREAFELFLLRLPAVGPMIQAIVLTRVMRILELLLRSGVPILRALDLSRAAANHAYYDALLKRVMDNVSSGKGVASALVGDPYFPGSITDMVSTAERTGSLPEVFRVSADHYQKELDNSIEDAFAAMEPIFIAGLSLFVAMIAICILAPIMSLGTLVEG